MKYLLDVLPLLGLLCGVNIGLVLWLVAAILGWDARIVEWLGKKAG